jgi:hypothetical protein
MIMMIILVLRLGFLKSLDFVSHSQKLFLDCSQISELTRTYSAFEMVAATLPVKIPYWLTYGFTLAVRVSTGSI